MPPEILRHLYGGFICDFRDHFFGFFHAVVDPAAQNSGQAEGDELDEIGERHIVDSGILFLENSGSVVRNELVEAVDEITFQTEFWQFLRFLQYIV